MTNPIKHFLISLAIAIPLYFYGFNPFVIIAAGVLVDVDHLFGYWFNQDKFSLNPIKVYKWYSKEYTKQKQGGFPVFNVLRLCHTYEFLLICFFVCIPFNDYSLFIGVITHQMTDKVTNKKWKPESLLLWLYLNFFKYGKNLSRYQTIGSNYYD